MRICLVSSELAPFHGWGVGTATAALARALRDAGHEVHVLVDDLPGLREGFGREFPGVSVHILTREEFGSALRQFPCECTRRPIVVHRRLSALHEQFRFDCIEFNDFYADAYMALYGRRTSAKYGGAVIAVHLHSPIFLLREVNGQPEYDLDVALITHMEREAIRLADVLFSPSRAIVERIEASGEVTGLASRTAVVPYALPLAARDARPTRAERDLDAPPEVFFFGRLESRKGVEILIAAAQRLLRDGIALRVRITGVDTDCAPGRRSMREHLANLVGTDGDKVFVFEDNLEREQIIERISRADVCCFPAHWDNFPNACLEAMSLGACVVASSAGGISELIENDVSGILVPPGDVDALAAALRRATENSGLRARLGAGARERVGEVCNPRDVARRHIEAIGAARKQPAGTACTSRVKERVAVIIPVHDLGSTLEETLASVKAQTRPPDEVLVVDDGSTDPSTLGVLANVESQGVRVIRRPHRGLSAARNAGITATDAEWILPLDADDLLTREFISAALRAAACCPDAVLITSHMACFTTVPSHPEITFVPLGFVREVLPASNVASSAIALLRREAVVRVGLYDERMTAYEDWDLYCRLAARGYEAVVIPEPMILNRIRPDSMLRRMTDVEDRHLRAAILARYCALSARPDRTARIVLSLGRWHTDGDARAVAQRLVRENLRYRLADRASEVITALGFKNALKRVLTRVERRRD